MEIYLPTNGTNIFLGTKNVNMVVGMGTNIFLGG